MRRRIRSRGKLKSKCRLTQSQASCTTLLSSFLSLNTLSGAHSGCEPRYVITATVSFVIQFSKDFNTRWSRMSEIGSGRSSCGMIAKLRCGHARFQQQTRKSLILPSDMVHFSFILSERTQVQIFVFWKNVMQWYNARDGIMLCCCHFCLKCHALHVQLIS